MNCSCEVVLKEKKTALPHSTSANLSGKPEHWPVSNIWRPGNYLCKLHPIKRKANKGGLVKQAPFSSTLHLDTVTERAWEIGTELGNCVINEYTQLPHFIIYLVPSLDFTPAACEGNWWCIYMQYTMPPPLFGNRHGWKINNKLN